MEQEKFKNKTLNTFKQTPQLHYERYFYNFDFE